jgi:hypothetical protein
MSQRIQWCPRCKERRYHEDGGRVETNNIFQQMADHLGVATGGLERYLFLHNLLSPFFPAFPHVGGYARFRKCQSCGETWTSAEVPDLFFEVLCSEVTKLKQQKEDLAKEAELLRRKVESLDELAQRMVLLLHGTDPA